MKTIGFIGTGNMATALIKAVLKAKIVSHNNIISSDTDTNKLENIKKESKIETTTDNKEVVQKSDVIFLCVKPQNMEAVLEEIKKNVTKEKLIVSIAAGLKITYFEKKFNNSKIIRVMPNLNCIVGEGAAAFSMGKNTDEKDKELIERLLNSGGRSYLLDESLIDAFTAAAGSSMAFFSYIIDCFKDASVKYGLKEELALELAEQTAFGTAKLLLEKKIKPDELSAMVSSPKGTTLAGRAILENGALKEIIYKTFEATIKRSKELGK